MPGMFDVLSVTNVLSGECMLERTVTVSQGVPKKYNVVQYRRGHIYERTHIQVNDLTKIN